LAQAPTGSILKATGAELDKRRQTRRNQRCFRRDPAQYLSQSEECCLDRGLPSEKKPR
jgi:hypothetical protein